MPIVSPEPRYELDPAIVDLLEDWEEAYPGLGIALADELSCGNWDDENHRDEHGQWVVPPFTFQGAVDYAIARLEPTLVKLQCQKQVRSGPWLVRLGLAKPSPRLDEKTMADIERMTAQARQLTRTT